MAHAVSAGPSRWTVAARGIVAILFGLAVLVWQHLTLRALLILLGAFVLVTGALALAGAVRAAERHRSWQGLALEGAAGVIVGGLILLAPATVAPLLLYLIALWAAITGLPELADGLIHHDWLLTASGGVLLLFAILIAYFTATGNLGITWVIGVFAVIYGALTLARLFYAPHVSA